MTAMAPETRTMAVERDLPHPAEKVWRALTQPHLMAEWLMKNDFVPAPGHRFALQGGWGGTLDCEVLAVEPPTRLSYSWDFPHDDPAFDLRSTVTFTLTPTAAGTRLRVEQEGFRPDQRQAFGGAAAGWRQFLGNLDQLLDRL
jgi:uncharacterized protein YndB with AHSA1/START domain